MRNLPQFSVDNPVLVGIVMAVILLGGAYSSTTLIREMFPESRPNVIAIVAPYPGATPAEIEKGLAQRIEEAIQPLENIEKVTTEITEGSALVRVELTSAVKNLEQAVNDFKAAIDTIPRDELPEDAEEIRVSKVEPKLPVIAVTIYGDVDEATLKPIGEDLRDDLLRLDAISDVKMGGIRDAELTVEVEPEKLIAYHLSLAQITDAIRQANLDLPAGQIKTSGSNVAIRTLGETDDVSRIADTIVRTTPDGRNVRVRDLGRVIDGFADRELIGRFNARTAVSATVYKTGDQDAIEIASLVKAFAAGKAREPMTWDWRTRLKNSFGMETEAQQVYREAYNSPYPHNLTVRTHSNLSRFIEDRLELLQRNGMWGLLFVFLSLLLFLNWRVAFWVMMGLVVSVAGAIVLMQILGATLNLISMFGLIVVLGLIVDDAIVVSENVYTRIESGESPRVAAVLGTQEVTWPVIIAVTTTIAAFAPLLFIEGRIGDFMGVLPIVVMCALSVSLLESLSILPAHLAKSLKPMSNKVVSDASGNGGARRPFLLRLINSFRGAETHVIKDVLGGWYERVLRITITYRYAVVAGVVALMLIAVGAIDGGRVPFVFIQKMDSETVLANLDMPIGTPAERTLEAAQAVENAVLEDPEVQSIWTVVGAQLDADEHGTYETERSHLGQVIIELKSVEERERSSDDIINDVRRKCATIPGVNSLTFQSMQGGPAGKGIELEITGTEIDEILAAAHRMETELSSYAGVYDLDNDYEVGRRELQIDLLESARSLGLTTRALATEVRGAFYGLEARTIQRGREDVDIRVRFPEARRRKIHELETMRVVTPSGAVVPFCEAARLVEARGEASIRRVNQRRAVTVSADVAQGETNADEIIASLEPVVRELEQQHPGIRIAFAGNKREASKSLGSLRRDFFIAIALVYFLLAGLFKSYIQPLIVLTAVPFGLIGAVAGHAVMGYPLTMLSVIGLVALTGMVVNDSLILVDFVNREVAAGKHPFEAVVSGGVRRLRPILLTSLTTILGLAPLMMETSFQAKFLIPLAISITFGLGFATALTLVVVPANYLIVLDLRRLARHVWYGPEVKPLTSPASLSLASGEVETA